MLALLCAELSRLASWKKLFRRTCLDCAMYDHFQSLLESLISSADIHKSCKVLLMDITVY